MAGAPASQAGAATVDPHAPYNGRFYGSPIGADMHGNTFIGKGKTVSMRFQAEETGLIKSFNWQLRHDGPPPHSNRDKVQDGWHSDGMGGTVTVQLRRDTGNGTPNMAPSGLIAETRPNNGERTALVLRRQETRWSFISPGAVRKGQLYHMVFINTHPTDFVSINALLYFRPIPGALPGGHHGPYYGTGWGNLYRNRGQSQWFNRFRLPFITFDYTHGVSTGVSEDGGFMDTIRTISTVQRARQVFTVVDRSYFFKAIWFRIWSVQSTGELIVRVENGRGAGLFEKAIPARRLPIGDWQQVALPWTRIETGAPLRLTRNGSYRIVFHAKSGSFRTTAMRDGRGKGFVTRNTWLKSSAEFSRDAGRTWWGWTIPNWNPTNHRRDMRLPAAFELV